MDTLVQLMPLVAERCRMSRLPDSYLVIDLETSGFKHTPAFGQKPDVIVQLGIGVVQDRALIENTAFYIKRPAGTMSAEATKVNGITDDMLAKNGVEPGELYPRVLSLLNLYRQSKAMFIGHNIAAFDAPFLSADLTRHGFTFKISIDEYIDTGMLFKAAQMRVSPLPSETLHHFYTRVGNSRSFVKWNLVFATQQLQLDTRYNLDLKSAHDAAFDCKLTHLLFEELRKLANI